MFSSRASPLLRSSLPYANPFRYTVVAKRHCASCDAPTAPELENAPKKSKAKAATTIPTPPADHRHLAIDQEIFTTSLYSPGSPLFLPNGTRIFNKLTGFLRTLYEYTGFQEVITPTIYKKSLWEKSGHWENYAEDMFSVEGRGASGDTGSKQIGEDEEFGLKPMNCPGHCILFASKQRSFRDLPIRYADFSPLHRNEISGALSGLTRVRRFHQDDGHIFCRPSQVEEEIRGTLDFVKLVYTAFNLGPYRLALSTRPKDHFIGTEEEWNNAEQALRTALDASGQPWTLNEGDGAFYGPKIDIILKDSDGKEHQTATVQLDFQLPKRFKLEYMAPAPALEQRGLSTDDPAQLAESGPVRPVMIHRAVLGSVERFMALLIEHYNGKWPFWLAPRQVMIVTVSDDPEILEYAGRVKTQLQVGYDSHGSNRAYKLGSMSEHLSKDAATLPAIGLTTLAVDLDDTPRSVSKKISEAKRKHYSVIVVIGKKNCISTDHQTVNVDWSGLTDAAATLPKLHWGQEEEQAFVKKLKSGSGADASSLVKNVEMTSRNLRDMLVQLTQLYR